MRSITLPKIAVIAALISTSVITVPAQTPSASISPTARTYKVKIGKKDAGWERVQISRQDKNYNISSTGQLEVAGVQYSITTSAEIADDSPIHYSLDVKYAHNENKYTIDFKDGQAVAKLESGHHSTERKIVVSKDLTLLDRNVWYQYQFLIGQYDMEDGGIQSFDVFIAHPTLRQYSALVEFQEETQYKFNGQKIDAKVFGVELAGGFQLLVTVDDNGVPLEIDVPSQNEKITLEPQ